MTTLPELTENELNTLSEAHKQMLSDKPEGQAVAFDPRTNCTRKSFSPH